MVQQTAFDTYIFSATSWNEFAGKNKTARIFRSTLTFIHGQRPMGATLAATLSVANKYQKHL